ncbi:pyridoxal phosphate-dependent transferase [Pisolithus orientalis]|uniref:pyridoxal phosphate-dependent transferase n=1 Tax=Pisolithus orientalis TaxID=936130 RepID=UPI0022246779|nr:pyridoxal phosphate-dependent transferase [Pisolithus orientalis]KAI6025860.1 pyridoxal phosphate-dependent transferase [Pisolithus orientalis]
MPPSSQSAVPLVPIPAAVDLEELYKTPPPAFGHEMLKLFGFDPKYVNLNNGSYGSLPLPVRVACDSWTTEIESNPDVFIRYKAHLLVDRARERISQLIGADTDECVIVNNTSHGIATVLRNFSFKEGDVLIAANISYGSISKTLKYLGDIPPHPTVLTYNAHFPTTHEVILGEFRQFIQKVKEERDDPHQSRTFIAIIDSITSRPGVLMPWKEMVAICKDAGVYSLVDAAHSIGQELDLNLSEAKPDFWVSNCHKWLYAKRGCAVLYVPKRNQHIIKSPIPTPVEYHSPQDEGYKGPQEFVKLFEWTGTIDHVPHISPIAALDFRAWLGGEHKINKYTHELAIEGGKYLAQRFGTSLLDPEGSLTLNMVVVELPIPEEIQQTSEVVALIQDTLCIKWNVSAAFFRHNKKWWVRCSAQIYNELSDFHAVADALEDAVAKVIEFNAGRTN